MLYKGVIQLFYSLKLVECDYLCRWDKMNELVPDQIFFEGLKEKNNGNVFNYLAANFDV